MDIMTALRPTRSAADPFSIRRPKPLESTKKDIAVQKLENIAANISLMARILYWIWLTITAPLRLAVWIADAVIAVTAAIGIGLVVAWFQGWLPDDLVFKYAQTAANKITALLTHAADVGGPGRSGPGRG